MTLANKAFVSCIIYVDACLDDAMLDFIERTDTYLRSNFSTHELILVNDSGRTITDGVLELIDDENEQNIVLLDLACRHGLERAMLAGSDLAIGDFIFEVDYPEPNLPPECLGTMFNYAQEHGADIVGGTSRQFQPVMSTLFYKTLARLQMSEDPFATEVLRLVSRRALNRALNDRRNIRYRKLLYSSSGFRSDRVDLGDVRISVPHRQSYRLALGLDVISASSRFGSSTAALLAMVFLAVSLAVGVYAFIVWLIGMPVAEGWTTLMGLLSIGLTGIFAVLSLIARMLSILLDEVQNAEPYKVREVVRLGNK
jgi:dolichol-phosphate mannosyltransferase